MKLRHISESNKIDIDQLLRQLYGDDYKDQIAKSQEIPYARTGDAESDFERSQNREYHRDQDRLDQLRGFDRLEEEPADDYQLNEISNELLQRYKQAAALDAGAADKIGFDPSSDRKTAQSSIDRANKRFSGIVKATKKQFANDKKTNEGTMGGINRSAPAQDVSYEKVLDNQVDSEKDCYENNSGDAPIAYHLVDGKTNTVIGKYKPEQRGRARARRDKLDNAHGSYRYKVVPVYSDSASTLTDDREYYQDQAFKKYVVVDTHTGETVSGPFADKVVAMHKRDKLDSQAGGTRYRVEPYRKMGATDPLEEKDPCWDGYKKIGMKDKGGKQVPNCVPVNENKNRDRYEQQLADILARQETEKKTVNVAKPGESKTEFYNYHGYEIKYRDKGNGNVDWAVIKGDDLLHKSSSASAEQAKMDAERFIQGIQGKGTASNSSSVIDFNSSFAKEFAPTGETFYVLFHRNPETNNRYIVISPTRFEHSVKSSIRSGNKFPGVGLTAKENRTIQLVPHGRYSIDTSRPDPIDEIPGAVMYPIILQGEAYEKNDRVHMKEPGFTVGSPR